MPVPIRCTQCRTSLLAAALLLPVALLLPAAAAAQSTTASAPTAAPADTTVEPGRFDMGRMWTFEHAPAQYFSETYGFAADAAWFTRARLSVLRIPGCSASFVSASGLVVTNHHCVRNAIVQVTGPGESLIDHGFMAATAADERRIPNYYADQLLAVEDVTEEVFRVTQPARDDAERQRLRQQAVAGIQQRLTQQYAGAYPLHVQVIPLYQGGRHSAYVFRRFTDVRLVAAAELLTGYFGGDRDNFTYPRYSLDFAFLRVYDEQGRPYAAEHHFAWGGGVEDGDVVFVIGNPGATNRLTTMAQLAFFRDVLVPAQIALFQSRLAPLENYYQLHPERPDAAAVRNRAFSISNTLKAAGGRLDALHHPLVMARREAGERAFLDSLRARPGLQQQYGDVIDRIAGIQAQKRELASDYAAFLQFGSAAYWPAMLRRGFAVNELRTAQQAGAPADTLAAIRRRAAAIADNPIDVEIAFMAAVLTDFERLLGWQDTILRAVVGPGPHRFPGGAAHAAGQYLRGSLLGDSATFAALLAADRLPLEDHVVRLASVIAQRRASFAQQYARLTAQEAEQQARLGRARFEIFGTAMPPDGTSSPRITDGIVSGYDYNGTFAPPYTTFFGMYDRYRSFGPGTPWDLPARWATPPAGLDLGTPLNFVSTADTYGGNSGSPAVTPRLEIVGLNFDRNIQGLSRDYIFLPEGGRNVMVDVRAIEASLRWVYGGGRILAELGLAVR